MLKLPNNKYYELATDKLGKCYQQPATRWCVQLATNQLINR